MSMTATAPLAPSIIATSPAIEPPAASFFMPGDPMTELPDGHTISDADAMAVA